VSSSDPNARLLATEAALGEAPVVDGHLDLAGALRVARGDQAFWLRAAPDGGAAGADGYGPAPVEPRWLRVTPGEPTLTSIEGGASVVAAGVAVRIARTSWGTSAAPFIKTIARAAVELNDGAVLWVATAIADDEEAARAPVAQLASALAGALAVPVSGVGTAPPTGEADAARPAASVGPGAGGSGRGAAPGRALVRFSLGWEGDRLVLRDRATRGPREGAVAWAIVVGGSLVAAGVAVASLVRAVGDGAPWTAVALRGSVVAVFLLAAFAFFHVTRHALRYRAAATPIAVFADDRIVVAPWVRRDGAIDPRLEGRFGAGIRAAEVHEVHVVERAGRHAVSLDTEHGPIDLADLEDASGAEALRAVIERALAGVASPARRKTAIMRGRARAAAATS
jgi:hypothetical protein